ncbi:MFS transporter [Microlunatus sp. Y2014]|uniref:MFS transporter n=1 Tax=Microlunatus sp. Y2014 TaxID=3418488 RepID=UPI003DA7286F
MELVRNLRRLWHHQLFRRLLAVRVAVQSCDGLLQAALASYVLFSTQRQPDAVSIAIVLAITLLPFSIVGPFVAVVLDRWSRRQALVVVDLVRVVLCLAVAGIVIAGQSTIGVGEFVFYGLVLVLMSLNRFVLATLSSALPHTIDADEYLVANAVVPTVGPAGTILGAGIGLGGRLLLGPVLPPDLTDGILFALASVGYLVSVLLALRIGRTALGPDIEEPTRAKDVAAGLVATLRHLGHRRPAAIGLLTIAAQRIPYGLVTVATILVYRNHFHPLTEVDAALGDLSILLLATAIGFVLAAVVTPPMARRFGLRGWLIITLVGSAVLQVVPGAIYRQPTLVAAAFALGVFAQSLKIGVDTLVQAHVDDEHKGRTFIFYDMIFNVTLVLGAVLCALIMPPDGVSVPVLLGIAGCYLVVAVGFTLITRGIDRAVFDTGLGGQPSPEQAAANS